MENWLGGRPSLWFPLWQSESEKIPSWLLLRSSFSHAAKRRCCCLLALACSHQGTPLLGISSQRLFNQSVSLVENLILSRSHKRENYSLGRKLLTWIIKLSQTLPILSRHHQMAPSSPYNSSHMTPPPRHRSHINKTVKHLPQWALCSLKCGAKRFVGSSNTVSRSAN